MTDLTAISEFIDTMLTDIDVLKKNLNKAKKGNKAAAYRARKGTLLLDKAFLEFRKRSIKEIGPV